MSISNEHIELVDYAGGMLTAQRHAIVTSAVVNGMGIYHGCVATIANSNTIHLSAGYVTIYGRMIEVMSHDYPVTLASSGTLKGRLYCVLDLGNTDEPCDIMIETGSTLSDLPDDPSMNYNNGKSAFEIATFTVGTSSISNLKNVAPSKQSSYAQITDFISEVTGSNTSGYIDLPGGIHMEWGKGTATYANANTLQLIVNFKKGFSYPPMVCGIISNTNNTAAEYGENVKARAVTVGYAGFFVHNAQGGFSANSRREISYFAIGK